MTSVGNVHRLIVTGASAGLGHDVCEAALSRGWSVVAIDGCPDCLRHGISGLGIEGISVDMRNESAVNAAVKKASRFLGDVPDRLMTSDGALGSFYAAKAVADRMRGAAQGGSMVLQSDGETYPAGVRSIDSMTRELSKKWAAHNIRVNAVKPGWSAKKVSVRHGKGIKREREPNAVGAPRYFPHFVDAASACLYLLDEESAHITGALIPVEDDSRDDEFH